MISTDLQGILLKLSNVFIFSLASVLMKKFLPEMNTFQVILLINILCLLFIVFKYPNDIPNRIIPKRQDTIRSFSNIIAILTWIFSIQIIPVSLATSISSITPIASMILAVYFLNEKLTIKKLFALSLGIIGMHIAINPIFSYSAIGSSLAILSSLFWALHDLITKKQASKDSWIHQAFYIYLISIPLLIPFALHNWKNPSIPEVFCILMISILMLFNKFLLVSALKKTTLSLITPIIFCRFIFTSLLAYIILGEVTTKMSWYATILILCGASITITTREFPQTKLKKV